MSSAAEPQEGKSTPTPVQIEVQGFMPSAHVRELIETNMAKLENRHGRVASCRVAIRAPGPHHVIGEPYSVSIWLSLPQGREVKVGPTPNKADQRQADVAFAIHDAFRRAMRQLRDQRARLGRQVKKHVSPSIGKVSQIDPGKHFGFLVTADGRELFFHENSVLANGFAKLKPGTSVAYHEEIGEKGPQASTVRIVRRSTVR